MNNSNNLRQALEHIHALPPIPKIAQEILSLKLLSEEGEQALLELIKQDPAISAKVIGLANSPLFGTSRKITSVYEAASVLGIRRIKMTALSFAMMAAITRTPTGVLNANNLWQHSLAVAMTVHSMAQHLPASSRPAEDDIFLAGLLHDFGFLVLDYLDPMLSDKFHIRLAGEIEPAVEEIENDMLGLNHCELGAELASHWGLPADIVAVLRYHHCPAQAPAAVLQGQLAQMIHLAEKLLPTFGTTEQATPDIAEEIWYAAGIDPSCATELLETAQEHAKHITPGSD
jgi:HD-like signal output (HDOD) protein